MLVSARGTLKPCLTNDCRHLAKRGEVHFIPTRADCFIMLSPLDKTVWVCTEGWFRGQMHSVIWCHGGCFCSLTRYLNFVLQRRGSGVHLFCSPASPPCNCNCMSASFIFFITHLFPASPGLFSFIRLSPRRQCKASQCCRVASRHKFILWWAGEKSLYNRDQGD